MKRSPLLAVTALLTVMAAASCGDSNRSTNSAFYPEAAYAVPADTLTDWLSYADQVSTFTVTSATETPLSLDAMTRREGTTNRILNVNITSTVWTSGRVASRSGLTLILTEGYVYKDGDKLEIRSHEGPRLEVGLTYLAALADFGEDFGPLTPAATVEVRDGKLVATADEKTSAAKILDGLDLGQAGDRIKGTEPDPIAVELLKIEPKRRYIAVLEERKRRGMTAP